MTEFYYLLFIYTFTLFTFLVYLLYLRVYHLGKLTGLKVKATINMNFYVFLFYLSFFIISLLLSCFVYLVDLGGAAIGRILTETIPDDFRISCDDPGVEQVSRNNELASHKDVTPNSPSEPKRPEEGSVGATWQWLCESVSNTSLRLTKDAAIRASENNLVHRNDAAVKNTIQEFAGGTAVPAKTLNFAKTMSPLGYGVVEGEDGKITPYAIADMRAAKTSYDERIFSGNVKPVYSTLENIGIHLSLATNRFGEPLAIPLTPDQAAFVVEDMGYKVEQLSDSLRPNTHTSVKALTDGTGYSPPPTPTSARNTHNPF